MHTAVPDSGWFKSTYSTDSAACVEVAFAPDAVFIRDSKYRGTAASDPPAQPILTFTPTAWHAFLSTIKPNPDL